MPLDFCALPVHALLPLLQGGQTTCVEVTQAYLARIRALDGVLHAFLAVYPDEALARAAEADERRAAGLSRSALDGVPVAVKANLAIAGKPLSCASRILEGYSSPYSATAVERLLGAGLPILGQTNLDEFAMGGGTEHSAFGPSRNPFDPARVPGGSSGGSAAAVAAGMAPLALGSDTGGSIRQPAAYCGVCGLKPTYGAVSRYGLAAFASSLDCVGPIAKDAEDCALLLRLLAGPDPRDATCAGRAPGPIAPLIRANGLTVAVWSGASAMAGDALEGSTGDDLATDDSTTDGSAMNGPATDDRATDRPTMSGFTTDRCATNGNATDSIATDGHATDDRARNSFASNPSAAQAGPDRQTSAAAYAAPLRRASSALAGLGAALRPVSLPLCRWALPAYYALACAEAGSNLARYDGVRYGRRADAPRDVYDLYARSRGEGFGDEARRRVLLGAYALQSGSRERAYQHAQRVRDALTAELDAALTDCDALLCPAAPTAAYPLGARDGDPTRAYRDDAFTVPFSLAGMPALALPCGADADGLPLGVQLIGRRGDEARLLALATLLQSALPTPSAPYAQAPDALLARWAEPSAGARRATPSARAEASADPAAPRVAAKEASAHA